MPKTNTANSVANPEEDDLSLSDLERTERKLQRNISSLEQENERLSNLLHQLHEISNAVDSNVSRVLSETTGRQASEEVCPYEGRFGEMLFSDWFENFELIAQSYNWDEADKIRKLPRYLKGTALSIYRNLDKEIKNNYQALIKALKKELETEEHQKYASLTLNIRKQNLGEGALQFSQALAKLARRAYPQPTVIRGQDEAAEAARNKNEAESKIFDVFLRERFILGLRPELLHEVLAQEPASFAEAVKIAQKVEAHNRIKTMIGDTSLMVAEIADTRQKQVPPEIQKLQTSLDSMCKILEEMVPEKLKL